VSGKRYSITLICTNGAELESKLASVSLEEVLKSSHVQKALESIPADVIPCAILIYEIGSGPRPLKGVLS
jgi:hypothetical protein